MADPLTTTLLAISATASAGSLYSQSRAAKAQAKASAAQRRQEALAAAVQRREQQKAGRRAVAMALQAGENQGVAGSSGVAGGVGSAISQTTANLSFLDGQTQLADFAGSMFDKAQRWSNRAQMFEGISKLAMVGADTAAGAAAAKKAEEEAAALAADRKRMWGG
jgi:hypothetical protein